METKLQSMDGFEIVQDNLNGLELIKLLWKAYFEQYGANQAILNIVEANKKLMLFWQKSVVTINKYTWEFKACIEVCEVVCSGNWVSKLSMKLACVTSDKDYDRLKDLVNGDKIVVFKKMGKQADTIFRSTSFWRPQSYEVQHAAEDCFRSSPGRQK